MTTNWSGSHDRLKDAVVKVVGVSQTLDVDIKWEFAAFC